MKQRFSVSQRARKSYKALLEFDKCLKVRVLYRFALGAACEAARGSVLRIGDR
jgi:hypothetical protein